MTFKTPKYSDHGVLAGWGRVPSAVSCEVCQKEISNTEASVRSHLRTHKLTKEVERPMATRMCPVLAYKFRSTVS